MCSAPSPACGLCQPQAPPSGLGRFASECEKPLTKMTIPDEEVFLSLSSLPVFSLLFPLSLSLCCVGKNSYRLRSRLFLSFLLSLRGERIARSIFVFLSALSAHAQTFFFPLLCCPSGRSPSRFSIRGRKLSNGELRSLLSPERKRTSFCLDEYNTLGESRGTEKLHFRGSLRACEALADLSRSMAIHRPYPHRVHQSSCFLFFLLSFFIELIHLDPRIRYLLSLFLSLSLVLLK